MNHAKIRLRRELAQARALDELLAQGCIQIAGSPMYWVSPQGKVYSTFGRRILELSPGTKPGGYLFVGLRCQRGVRYFMVHRLVANAFLPNPADLPEVNHKDGVKAHNGMENLEWCNRQYNIRHAFGIGLVRRGSLNPLSKLQPDQVRAIRASTGVYKAIGAMFGVSAQTVCNVKRRSKYSDVI